MPLVLASNRGRATLAGGISNVSTTANLATGTGALFPSPSNGQYFVATLVDQVSGLDYEIVYVTGRSGDTVTMVRAQEGTVARNWIAGDFFLGMPSAGQFMLAQQTLMFAGNPNGSVAGVTGVGGFGPTLCWDSVNKIYWVCVATGTAGTAVWATLGLRGRLFANTTYYIATTGSDSNPGTLAEPWLTRQHAWDFLVSNVDLGGFQAIISVAAGTYTDGLAASGTVQGSLSPNSVVFIGDIAVPANCFINTVGTAFGADGGVQYTARGFRIAAAAGGGSPGFGLQSAGGSHIFQQLNQFSGCDGAHQEAETGGKVTVTGNYSIDAGAAAHMLSHANGLIFASGMTVSLSGTSNFSSAFAQANQSGSIEAVGTTYSGAATGPRYLANMNGTIQTQSSADPNYFPGDSAGTKADGGQYN